MFQQRMMTLVLCGASALSVAAFAQDSGQTTGSTGGTASKSGSAKDKAFIRKAAEGGMLEVKLGQLAAQKGSGQDVKSFGQKMVDDHTALNESMKPIADKMGVKVPEQLNSKDQAMYDKMNAMSGTDFDNAYIKDMVKDHHMDLKEFTAEANTASDPDLKAAVEHGRDVIKQHTDMIDQMAKDKGLSASGGKKMKNTCAPAQ